MKKVIGFALFFIAVGMLIMLIISNDFLGIIIICILAAIGYHLFCKEHK